MESICRLCSCYSPILSPVFSFSNDRLIFDMITVICPIRIDPGDTYPKGVCKSCLKTIISAYDLRCKSVESDIKFKSELITEEAPVVNSAPVEAIRIKQEGNSITFMDVEDESCDRGEMSDSNDGGNSESDNLNMTPYEPKKELAKQTKYKMTKDGKFKCPHTSCYKSFSHQTNVRRHLKMEHGGQKGDDVKSEEEDKSATCHICGQVVQYAQNLKRHILKLHPGVEIEAKVRKNKLKTHPWEIYFEYHEKGNYTQCLECKSKLSGYYTFNLKRHLITEHSELAKSNNIFFKKQKSKENANEEN